MTSANSPPSPSVQDSPPSLNTPNTATSVTILPPERVPLPRPDSPTVQSPLARVDLPLAAFVVALAFLVASTAARNSDLWLHLAIGRAVADGSYRFHGDPFGQDATSWVAHSWLYDLVAYGLYEWLGGGILVFLKAALVALLAALLIRLGTRERGRAWPAVCATLSVLTLSSRLLLQPALVSVVLLAVTLWLLERARRLRAEAKQTNWLRAYGPLCLLFPLWANVDDWFLLGPVAVALYLLGEGLAVVGGSAAKDRADLPGLSLLLGAGLLACLFTPFTIHGFALPAELGLSASASALERDPTLRGLFLSPFDGTYFRVGAAWSVPGVAYLTLAGLSLLSFAGSRNSWRSWRLPVWLGFLGLSAWSVRAVPFFAVAAGPILALNLQDFVRRFDSPLPRHNDLLLARLGRAAAFIVLTVLLVAAWPGWLQNPPYEMRRWVVLADPSVEAGAKQLAEWRKDGSLNRDEHGFNLSPEVANYFAWFCPAEKGLVDSRLQLSSAEAADYVTVRRALLDGPTAKTDWRAILRARHIDHVILYDSNHERVSDAYRRLARNAEEWSLLFLAGRTAIFAWHDPQNPRNALAELALPLKQEAYHPAENKRAPREWPGRGPQTPAWWSAFVTARPAGSPDRDEAALLLLHFETEKQDMRLGRMRAWEVSRIAGAAGAGGRTLSARLQQALDLYSFEVLHTEAANKPKDQGPTLRDLALTLRDNYFLAQDDAPPEFLWMALRAARRALHDNPDDAYTYQILGEVYLRLLRNTRERVWTNRMPFLSRLREIQASAAFNQALLLQPDLILAHAGLVSLYQHQSIWDLRLHHLREILRLTKAKGAAPGESLKEWNDRLARLKDDVQQLEEDLQRIQDVYELNAVNRKIMDRAEGAHKMGLSGKALDILLTSDAASFGQKGVQLELHLLLTTGRVREVREWLLPEHRETLGDEIYQLNRMELSAACGDYDRADLELADLIAVYENPITLPDFQLPLRQAMAMGVAQSLLANLSRKQSLLDLTLTPFRSTPFLVSAREYADRLRRIADLTVLRGLMALERGDDVLAEQFLHQALELCASPEDAQSGAGLDFSGRLMAEHLLQQLSFPRGEPRHDSGS